GRAANSGVPDRRRCWPAVLPPGGESPALRGGFAWALGLFQIERMRVHFMDLGPPHLRSRAAMPSRDPALYAATQSHWSSQLAPQPVPARFEYAAAQCPTDRSTMPSRRSAAAESDRKLARQPPVPQST